jgi:hypothetical protein
LWSENSLSLQLRGHLKATTTAENRGQLLTHHEDSRESKRQREREREREGRRAEHRSNQEKRKKES